MVTFIGGTHIAKPASHKRRPTPSYQERVSELEQAGLSVHVLAESIGVTDQSVRHWLIGRSEPASKSQIKINNLRRVLHDVIEAGAEPESAAVWMRTPVDEDSFPNTPMEVIGDNPEVVFKVVDLIFKREYVPPAGNQGP